MSQICIPDSGKIQLAKMLTGALDVKVRLYKARAHAIDEGIIVGDITEANFSGYAAVDAAGWALLPGLNADGEAEIQANEVTFEHNGGVTANDILGYYLTYNLDGTLVGIEEDDRQPFDMSVDGDKIRFKPKLTVDWDFDAP